MQKPKAAEDFSSANSFYTAGKLGTTAVRNRSNTSGILNLAYKEITMLLYQALNKVMFKQLQNNFKTHI